MTSESAIISKLIRLRCLIAVANVEMKAEQFARALKANYDPNQPRVPAGNPDGGQWTSEGGEGGLNDPRVLTDATPDNDWIPGAQYAASKPEGHHFMPQSLYRDLPLSPETQKVFDDAKTGKLHAPGHQYDEEHREYNKAVRDLFDRFMSTNNIRPEQMTPDQARSFIKEIKETREPRIRDYNFRIYMR